MRAALLLVAARLAAADHCDKPELCAPCCGSGPCVRCKACIHSKDGNCTECWAPNNETGGPGCLAGIGACQQCWQDAPSAVMIAPDHCNVPQCAPCCGSGPCVRCKECTASKDGNCTGCWAPNNETGGPGCLDDNKTACQACWAPPVPLPCVFAGPTCDTCCKGTCLRCVACLTNKEGPCAPCWAPNNDTGGPGCLTDDATSCHRCWAPEPAPAPPGPAPGPPAPAPPADHCDLTQCADCCGSGVCVPCKHCTARKDGNCTACWAPNNETGGPGCLDDGKTACQACWGPAPAPAPPGPPAPAQCVLAPAACDTCCKGTCLPCVACLTNKEGPCAPCWAPNNDTGGPGCLTDDATSCQACWGPDPVPAPPRPAPPAPPAPHAATYACRDGKCVAFSPGIFIESCQKICTTDSTYSCVNGVCVADPRGSVLKTCQASC